MAAIVSHAISAPSTSCLHCGSAQCLSSITGVCEELWNSTYEYNDYDPRTVAASNHFQPLSYDQSLIGVTSAKQTPSIASLPRSHRPSPSLSEQSSLDHSQADPTDAHSIAGPESCTCTNDALMVYEQVQYGQLNINELGFDQALSIAREANLVCLRYLNCQECSEDLSLLVCINALQVTAACYNFLSTQSLSRSSAVKSTLRCRIGRFETTVQLDSTTSSRILRDEVQCTLQTVKHLQHLLQPSSYADYKTQSLDLSTRQYNLEMIGTVCSQLQNTMANLMAC